MRTLQEKYNGIQEGKFSKEHFLAEARMQQPQLITRFNGYDDAVQILKNRGMIVENDPGSIFHLAKSARTGKYIVNKASKHASMAITGNGKKFKTEEEAQAEADRRNKDVTEAKLTKKSLTDYRYKATNDMDKYPYEQILRGIRVELETLGVHGTPTAEEYSKALSKVSKNLEKDSIFYTNQVAGVNPKVDLHDKMVPFTEKAKVDTFNGMKKAELKEGFKKLIKKVLSESMGDMFGDEERAARAANYGQPTRAEYEFFSDPENYNEEEEEFELHGDTEDDIDYDDENFSDPFIDGDVNESGMGDIYLLAQESDTLKDFLIKVKQAHPETDIRRDIEELQYIWNNRNPDEDESVYEGKKSLSQLLK